MRYLGGKSRIAKEIAAVVAPRGYWWEPFCGGLSVSVQLAKYGPGLVSDACLPLISLYQAVREGWDPPATLSKGEWQAAKLLPDTDPLKAFAGFGCSFGAKWFGGYTPSGSPRVMNTAKGPQAIVNDNPRATRAALLRDVPTLANCLILNRDFFAVDPWASPAQPECIYADPPYEGTTSYSAVDVFDSRRFWLYCQAWSARGVRVFVSEYACSVACDVVWEKRHRVQTGHRDSEKYRTERLFLVKPVADATRQSRSPHEAA